MTAPRTPPGRIEHAVPAAKTATVEVDKWVADWLTERAASQDPSWKATPGSLVKHMVDLRILEESGPPPFTILDTALIAQMDRLAEMARKRSESSLETLKAALDGLEAGGASVRPAAFKVLMAPDGEPWCKCDGPIEPGPHHRGCHRYRETHS